MKAIKRPIPIEVVVFDAEAHARVPIGGGVVIRDFAGGHQVYNDLHKSWIGVQSGDYLNITTPGDIYPIAKAVFETTYEVVEP